MPSSPPITACRSSLAWMARPDAASRFSTASNPAISSEFRFRTSINPATTPPPADPTASHRYTEPVALAARVATVVA